MGFNIIDAIKSLYKTKKYTLLLKQSFLLLKKFYQRIKIGLI